MEKSSKVYDQKIIDFSYRNAYFVPNLRNKIIEKFVKIILIKVISSFRVLIGYYYKLLIKVDNPKTNLSEKFRYKINDLNSIKDKYEKDGWCFIENFLSEETYKTIKDNWPKDFYFKPRFSPVRFYRIGFVWKKKLNGEFSKHQNKDICFKNNKALSDFYNYLNSSECSKVFSLLNNENQSMNCISIVSSMANYKSFLAPHKDGIGNKIDDSGILNCIYFIDGNSNNSEFSGATGIFEDLVFGKEIFIPKNIKNTALIYNSKNDFFHGFKVMKKGCHRKAITFQMVKNSFFKDY